MTRTTRQSRRDRVVAIRGLPDDVPSGNDQVSPRRHPYAASRRGECGGRAATSSCYQLRVAARR